VDLATLRCTVKVHGTSRIVGVEGEIDMYTVSHLRRAMRDAFQAHPETLVIDLAGVTFMDSTGLHALIDAHHRSHADGIRLVIVPGPEVVHHPFRLAGLDRYLPFVGPPTPDGR
jgi:anti-anti-sigma factor